MRSLVRLTGLGSIAILVAACASGGPSAAPATPSTAPATTTQPTAVVTAEPTADACATANLKTVTPGKLTIGTNNPAYPPYFAIRDGGNAAPWEDLGYTGDPTTGKGFEGAAAYAIAKQLGYSADQVVWVVVPFINSYAPGPKAFDFDINQVSYKPERAEAADLSDGYYSLNQAVVALKGNPAASATTVAELKGLRFGAEIGTTSYDAIIKVIAPTKEPSVYDTNDAAIEALKVGQIDAIVVDLPTADFITNVQIEDGKGTIVGQLQPFGGTPEYFALVLAKASALTPCVNGAIAALHADGTLAALAKTELPFQDAIPVIK